MSLIGPLHYFSALASGRTSSMLRTREESQFSSPNIAGRLHMEEGIA
jgi:hypothetical protein